MARTVIVAFAFAIIACSLGLYGTALAEEAGFTIERFVVAKDVVDREPVGVSETFRASDDMVYCFLEAADIAHDTEVAFVWYYEGAEVALVTLLIEEGPRWRTYSSKTIAGHAGQWAVALKGASGETISTITFTVE